jgi:hypothetical protein
LPDIRGYPAGTDTGRKFYPRAFAGTGKHQRRGYAGGRVNGLPALYLTRSHPYRCGRRCPFIDCTLRLPCAAPLRLRASSVALRPPFPHTHTHTVSLALDGCPCRARISDCSTCVPILLLRAACIYILQRGVSLDHASLTHHARPSICLQLYDLSLARFNKHVNWLVQRNHEPCNIYSRFS